MCGQQLETPPKSLMLHGASKSETPTMYNGEYIITNRRLVFKTIRAHLRKKHNNRIANLPFQGRAFSAFSADKASSHFNRTGDYLRFTDWRFIHKARLKTVALKGYRKQVEGVDRSCEHCVWERETLPHVLNHCRPNLHKCMHGHNLIVRIIKKTHLLGDGMCYTKIKK